MKTPVYKRVHVFVILSLYRSLRGKSFKKWLSDIKMVLTNPMAVLLLLFYATASGYSAMIATKLEQLMCSQVRYLIPQIYYSN